MGREKEKLTLRAIIIAGIKKFAGEIIGVILLACFLWAFPGFRSLFTDHTFPAKDESHTEIQKELEQHKQEEERLKAELKQREEALRETEAKKTEEARQRAKLQRQIEAQKAEEAKRRAERPKRVTAEKPKTAPTPKHPAMTDYEFLELCQYGDVREVEDAIKKGANIHYRDNLGWTPLMWAAIRARADVAEVLMKYGADVNIRNKNGKTALKVTPKREWADLLRSYGAKD